MNVFFMNMAAHLACRDRLVRIVLRQDSRFPSSENYLLYIKWMPCTPHVYEQVGIFAEADKKIFSLNLENARFHMHCQNFFL